jgi:hypothetical protein
MLKGSRKVICFYRCNLSVRTRSAEVLVWATPNEQVSGVVIKTISLVRDWFQMSDVGWTPLKPRVTQPFLVEEVAASENPLFYDCNW